MFSEEEILGFWKKNKVFEKSVAKRKNKKTFVFFEGPPTANGDPGVHHVEARSFKDIILRFKTMRGFFVPRRAGWDTHGLPVEVQVEKALGLRNKKEIEAYGVALFNKKCRESVWQYKELWERMTDRMGFWIDMAHPYITYENSYIEALWGIVKEFAKKELLYEDFKVLPWCARCGTALSSHELAQGYEKIKENSVFVKFKLKGEPNTYFLVWTTTPWTLPGNVALAINSNIYYVYAKNEKETLILAEARMSVLGDGYEIIKKIKGSELIDKNYEPLYAAVSPSLGGETAKLYQVVTGDFVSIEDGSGIVHIAPAFGDDDFQLSKKFDLPVLATTGQDGLMNTPGFPWNGGWFKKADPIIIEDLKSRKLLFKEEPYEHDYPFCWRCKSPLMYLARKSWWVDVNKVRAELLENNQGINWYPGYIQDGRFGEWLKEKKNWAFSRERYWGTPLPVWRCETRLPDGQECSKWEAVGSLGELKKRGITSGNKYFIMRHGESVTNVKNITNCTLEKNHYPLTPKGRKQVEKSAGEMKRKKIKPDFIFTSPFLRTKETAGVIAKILEVEEKNILSDPRLGEINSGSFAEGNPRKYHEYFKNQFEKFSKAPPGGESLTDVKKRMFASIVEIEERYKNKNILIISHEYPLWMLWAALLDKTNDEAVSEHIKRKWEFLKTASFEKAEFLNIPRDENLVLDMHKPYIDTVTLKCSCGGPMKRVPEVCDVWFDSGSMPFASNPSGFPADYIVEAIDQTRGWFYTLLAVSTLLGKGAPYKNVVSLGHVLDAKGKKMSKSLGNIVDPMKLIEQFGADAVRWYFFTINQPWDSKSFNEADVKDASRRFFVILWNILQFHKMYGTWRLSRQAEAEPPKTKLLINRWVLLQLGAVAGAVTRKLDAYDIVGAARDLENFVVEDISRWYVRRIRDVMKGDSKEMKETGVVLGYLLGEISKLLAPFAPFISEKIWMELGNKKSVHLEDWPKHQNLSKTQVLQDIAQRAGGDLPAGRQGRAIRQQANMRVLAKPGVKTNETLANMTEVRRIVGLALEARQKAGIKVRQPLSKIEIKNKKLASADKNFLELLKEEVNVKNVIFNASLEDEVRLDINITSELREEGILRDLLREIQSARKTAGLKPKDKVFASLELPREIFEVAKKYEKVLMKETNLKFIKFSESQTQKISLK